MTNAVADASVPSAEDRMIDAEYKIWKKNTPFLYDFVLTHALEWPSLTCQWLPASKNIGVNVEEHQLLIGTHTSGDEDNYLMVAGCVLPVDDEEPLAEEDGKVVAKDNKQSRFDEEKKEYGGYGVAESNAGKVEIKMKIKFKGEVNRARYMPSNHFIVAARGPSPEIYIFDRSKHPSFPDKSSEFNPQAACSGHSKEGYAMEWSPHLPGMLLSGSDDINLWDCNAAIGNMKDVSSFTQIPPTATFKGHKDLVEDVAWHPKDKHMFGSVSDDRAIKIWDSREPKTIKYVDNAHAGDINGISFNPQNEYLFATGSADKTVKLWDMRSMKCTQTLEGHTDDVYRVEWAPFNESILASCSDDRRVAIWDLSRIGAEQTAEDAEDGPPELLFLHGGHTSKVSDFAWNGNFSWNMASVSEDNVLQVWNIMEEIYKEEDGEEGEDDDLE